MKPTYKEGQRLIWQYGPLPHEKMKVEFKLWLSNGYAEIRGADTDHADVRYTARADELIPCRNLPAWF